MDVKSLLNPRPALATVDSNAAVVDSSSFYLEKPVPNKRKATDEGPRYEIDDGICQDVNISCDAVRSKIKNFLASGEIKVGEFQKAIGVNSRTYGNFIGQNGPYKGCNSSAYQNAVAFFKLRELNGIKVVKKKVKKEEESKVLDVSAIKLEGEDETKVPVYDNCDEIRRKIRAYLAEPSVTQAGFLREIAKTYPVTKNIQSKLLNDFLGKKGHDAGNTSSIYYASYVFFEKIRIRENKPKSKSRLENEKLYDGSDIGLGPGFDVKHRSSRKVWVTCLR